jgi:hypothetical protein
VIPDLRKDFNSRFTPEKYRRFLAELDRRCGMHVEFRNSETPCFFPGSILREMADTGKELIHQLVSNPQYVAASDISIPPEYKVPNEAAHPLFIQVDFGLDANLNPKLVEIQGFPSIYGYQAILAESYLDAYELSNVRYLLTDQDYWALLKRAIVGQHDPENVILMEIEPEKQKTRPDFLITEKYCGVKTVSVTDVRKRGNRLYYEGDTPIHRIYNRVIVDELQRKNIRPGFDFRDDLDIEWAGHPNWYFRMSKFSIPFLNHPSVPKTWFLGDLPEIPSDPRNYVLKPLYSFAGLGVVIGPTREQIAAVDPSQYILQEKVDFAPIIETPLGPTKAEVRVMYIWLDELEAVTTVVRMGRGKMMGVDHNRDMEWVGASAALMPLNA